MSARRLVFSVVATFGGVLMFASAPALAVAPLEAPELAVEAPVPATSATLRGVLNPKIVEPVEAGTYEFLYKEGKGECTGGSAAPVPPGFMVGAGPEPVAEVLTGLIQHTEYTACLRAETATHEEATSPAVTFTTALPPEAPETKPASEVAGTTAKLNGVLNPHSAGDPGTYQFFYRKSATECQGESVIGGGTEAHGVSPEPLAPEEVTGLSPATTYTVCLQAVNKAGESTLGNPVSFTTLAVAPTVSEEFATEISSGSATLHGQVNPGGADTTYRFEYGPTTSYGKSISGEVGTGLETISLSVHPQDLAPGAIYHYRLTASNEVEEVAGPDLTFTTQSSGAPLVLPDGRQWEMVSPPSKNGAEVSNLRLLWGGTFKAAENGDAVSYITSIPIDGATRSQPLEPQAFAKRGPDGWVSEDISTPHDRSSSEEVESFFVVRFGTYAEYLGFSPDLSLAYVEPEAKTPLAPGQPAPSVESTSPGNYAFFAYDSAYVRDMATGAFSITRLTPQEWLAEQKALAQGAKFTLESTAGTAGAGHGEYSAPQNAAAQQPSGNVSGGYGRVAGDDLFVADKNNDRVQVLSSKGDFVTEVTGAEVPGGLKEVEGVALDNTGGRLLLGNPISPSNGDLYVVAHSEGVVDKFKPKGADPSEGYEYVCQITGPTGGCVNEGVSTFSGPSTVAVDNNGNVYIGQSGGPVEEFDAVGNFVATIGSGVQSTVGIAVDATGNAVYVASETGKVTRLSVDPSSHKVQGEAVLAEDGARAVAVDELTGNVFIDSGASGIREYSEAATGASGEAPVAEFATKGEIGQGSLGIAASREAGIPIIYVTDPGNRVLTYRLKVNGGCDPSTSPAKGVGVDAVSKDGCYVYFNSEAVLAQGATGADPLYVSHYESGTWTTTFISSLSETGAPEWSGNYVELSPSGRYVAFMSALPLTGYDNRDAVTGARDVEVYLYDAAQDRLVCASCNPSGARPTGQFDSGVEGFFTGGELLVDRTSKWGGSTLAGLLPDWWSEGYIAGPQRLDQPRYVTDSGTLFFDSPDRLVAQDVNGLENVYEYEPEGQGACANAKGCVSLISSGASSGESALIEVSANGDDAFFLTSSRLVPADVDDLVDLYDAHVCSPSVPCHTQIASPPACETSDSCKAPPSPQSSAFDEPASATFAGAGNVPRAVGGATAKVKPKGKVTKCAKKAHRNRRGRCVVRRTKAKAKRSGRGGK